MKKYTFITILLVPLFCHSGCSSHTQKQDVVHNDSIAPVKSYMVKDSLPVIPIESFNKLFTDTAFKTLHIFSYDPYTDISADYLGIYSSNGHPRDNLRFKGYLIGPKFYKFLKNVKLDSVNPPEYYATFSFQLTPACTAYLIRILYPPGPHLLNELRFYTYNKNEKRIIKQFELVANTSEEGYSYKSESWISNEGKNGKDMVYTRSLTKKKIKPGYTNVQDTIICRTFQDTTWKNTPLPDQKALKAKYALKRIL